MKLSKSQLDPFWTLFGAAWRAHCAREGFDAGDTVAKEKWRHQQLHQAIGVYSLKQVPKTGPKYIDLMAHFEIIARNGIYWQMQKPGADTRALIHSIREICAEHDLDEQYVCGVARNCLHLEMLPDLAKLNKKQLLTLRQVLMCNVDKMKQPVEAPF